MNKISIVAAVAVAAVAVFLWSARNKKPSKAVNGAPAFNAPAALMANLYGQQVTLANGAVLDTENGVIFDPLTGNYTNTVTGGIIYAGAVA